MRIGCIRARVARKQAPPPLDHKSRPGFRKDPGLFAFPALLNLDRSRRHRHRVPQEHTDAQRASDCSLKNCREPPAQLGARRARKECGYSSAGRARPRHGRGLGFEPRYPLQHLIAGVLRHNGRVRTPESAGVAGMCAAGTPASCSETAPSEGHAPALAPEHNRNEIPPASLAWQSGCLASHGWRAPPCSVNSVARVPACLAGSRGFDSRTGRQMFAAVAQW